MGGVGGATEGRALQVEEHVSERQTAALEADGLQGLSLGAVEVA